MKAEWVYEKPAAIAAQPGWFMLFAWFKGKDGIQHFVDGNISSDLRAEVEAATSADVELYEVPIIGWRIQFQRREPPDRENPWDRESESVSAILVHDQTDGSRSGAPWLEPIYRQPDGRLVAYDETLETDADAKTHFLTAWKRYSRP